MSTRRETDTFEFTPPDFERLAGYLHHLTEAGSGWINLLPGVKTENEAVPTTAGAGLFALFGNRQAPVSMCTLMPASVVKQAAEGVTVGILHPTGAKSIARLAAAGVNLPPGWVVRQDHARRGLVVRAERGADNSGIIEWAVKAGGALCREEMTGQWQAVVYLP